MDGPVRDLDPSYVSNNTATVEWCLMRCKTLGKRYAGVQNEDECFCGNSFGRYGTGLPSTCTSLCKGNSAQTCGGQWRNEVYLIGKSFWSTQIYFMHLIVLNKSWNALTWPKILNNNISYIRIG